MTEQDAGGTVTYKKGGRDDYGKITQYREGLYSK